MKDQTHGLHRRCCDRALWRVVGPRGPPCVGDALCINIFIASFACPPRPRRSVAAAAGWLHKIKHDGVRVIALQPALALLHHRWRGGMLRR